MKAIIISLNELQEKRFSRPAGRRQSSEIQEEIKEGKNRK